MSRLYRVDIDLNIDKDHDTFTETDEKFLKYEVLPYLCVPRIDPRDPDIRKITREIAEHYDPFDHDTCYAAAEKGKKQTWIKCSRETSFTGGYSEAQFKEDIEKHLERFKSVLPFRFEAEIFLHYIEHAPALIINSSNLS